MILNSFPNLEQKVGDIYHFGSGNAKSFGTEEAATVGENFTLDVLDSLCPFPLPGAAPNKYPLIPANLASLKR